MRWPSTMLLPSSWNPHCFTPSILWVILSHPLQVLAFLAEIASCHAQNSQGHSIADIIAKIEGKPALGLSNDQSVSSVQVVQNSQGGNSWGLNSVHPEKNIQRRPTHHKAWMNSGKFQGDIITSPPGHSPQTGQGTWHNAVRNRQLRWTNGVVPYVLSPQFSSREQQIITGAMQSYHQKTCIRFLPRSNEYDYLYITRSYGCYSQVGKVRGRQELSLGIGCLFHEIAVHELMHALGFWHEHSRSDRDQFIRIRWENINTRMRGQFDKVSTAYQDFLGETYDYRSVMHYDSTAFSRNGLNTIETVQPGFTSVIGTATDLSEIDIRKVNKLYQCANQVVITTPSPFITAAPITAAPVTSVSSCQDKFLDCPYFHRYCFRQSFYFVMKLYCPLTCGHCFGNAHEGSKAKNNNPFTKDEKPPEISFRQAFRNLLG